MGSPAGEGVQQDRAALVALYEATGGARWALNTNWLSATPVGDWHGVTTDADGRVIRLELDDNNLWGDTSSGVGTPGAP